MNDGPSGSGRRWWEIRSGREQDEGGYQDLMTGGRSRTRLERSLTAGADPAEEPRRRVPPFVWPVLSMVGVGALVLGVVFLVPFGGDQPEATNTAQDSPARSFPRDGGDGGGGANSGGITFQLPPAGSTSGSSDGGGGQLPSFQLPQGGFGGSPGGGSGGGSNGSSGLPDAALGSGSDDTSSGSSGGQAADTGEEGSSGSSGDAPSATNESDESGGKKHAPIEVNGSAPPVPEQPGSRESVAVAERAPLFLANQSRPRAAAPPRSYPFSCQTSGDSYTVEGHGTSSWWAWFGKGRYGVWVPVLYLADSSSGEPVPGLSECGSSGGRSGSTSSSTSGSATSSAPSATSSSDGS